ncbi:putative WRKY transcription factor 51 [Acorus calamus]|uniref:WRKY transcription factor 51 n=1 Tax=Acorus calamus TaxID=4465 RepID=A0AAV9C0C6_ACOCL|nr:putative WRKY transcription factor 51 [Acorus calamus]
MDLSDLSFFEFAERLLSDEVSPEVIASSMLQPQFQKPIHPIPSSSSCNSSLKCMSGSKKVKVDGGLRIAFRTKSKLEILDDGYKWRKYGKKSVKNNPNPRNYYHCSTQGCHVKKRVERDGEDNSYVITTYEGVHNHRSPGVLYYDPINTSYM